MPKRSKRWIASTIAAGALLLGLALIGATDLRGASTVRTVLKNVRYWVAPDHTRIVLELDADPRFRDTKEGYPRAIILELPYTENRSPFWKLAIEDGLIEKIRLRYKSRDTLGVIIDLQQKAHYNVFSLKPYRGFPHRLVVDVFRPNKESILAREEAGAQGAKAEGNKIVIIDAGHGGDDPGAIGCCIKLREKNVALDIAQKLYQKLKNFPGITPYLTRKGDYFVSLGRRVRLARRYQADLFISIHANANRKTKRRGASVFLLSEKGASDKVARMLAVRENAADLIGSDVPVQDQLSQAILLDLAKNSNRRESWYLGKEIVKGYQDYIPQINMNADPRSAKFAVLKSLSIPSVLVETAHITNPKEEKLLAKSAFRSGIAQALRSAIAKYLSSVVDIPPGIQQAYQAKFHVVQHGESLWRIARQYGVKMEQLREWNKLGSNAVILPGQKLRTSRY